MMFCAEKPGTFSYAEMHPGSDLFYVAQKVCGVDCAYSYIRLTVTDIAQKSTHASSLLLIHLLHIVIANSVHHLFIYLLTYLLTYLLSSVDKIFGLLPKQPGFNVL